jgi:hypothetical protein
LQDPWNAFSQHVEESAKDFLAALTDFGKAVEATVKDPASFGAVGLPELLKSLNELVDALLELCDAIVDGFCGIAETAMDSLDTLLAAELNLGFLNTLWAWVAESAGYPEDSELTMAAVISLMAAFPCTVIYKLVEGVENEPFPNGEFPFSHQPDATVEPLGIGIEMPFACVLISAILQIVYVIPAAAGDFLGNNAPWWITAISIGFAIAIWALAHGYPDLSRVEWQTAATAVAMLIHLSVIVFIVLQTVAATFLQKVKANRADIADVLISIYGVGRFVLGIVLDFVTTLNLRQVIVNLLLPTPSIFGFCNMSTLRDDPEVAPVAIATNLAFDFIGYIGGGVIQAVEVVATRPATLTVAAS